MTHDKMFAAYAGTLMAGTITVITAAVLAGGQSFPPILFIVEHLCLSLLFRSAYKAVDGENWLGRGLDAVFLIGAEEAVEPTRLPTPMEADAPALQEAA